jgi:capsular exopolysaccharide synthesis family protein
MSQIFDALHQSQAEREANGPRHFSAARELLRAVERGPDGAAVMMDQPTKVIRPDQPPNFHSTELSLPAHSNLVCLASLESFAAEKFRYLATRLRHMQQKRPFKRLVITSSVSGEGKSMVAGNLACALGRGRQQVLLLEGDLRRPSLAQQLGLSGLPGLSQGLQGEANPLDGVYRLEGAGFCVLLAGNAHSNPLEFMQPERLSPLMDELSSGFDWVVIDSPPVLPLADTSIWMRLADAVLLITRPGVTTQQQLRRTLEAIEPSKLLGAVVNASAEPTSSSYYYHYAARPGGTPVPSLVVK